MHPMNFKSMIVGTLTALVLGLVWLLPKYLNLPTSHFVTMAFQILASLVIALLCAFFFYRQKMQAQAAPKNPQEKRFSKIKKIGEFLKIKSMKLYRYIKAQLQPHLRKKNQLLNHLPWYLFIGNPQSGKSSLLSQSNLSFLPTDYLQNLSKELDYPHTWHLTKEAILLELSLIDYTAIPESFWSKFRKFSRRYHRKVHFNGVVIAIDIAEMISAHIQQKESLQISSLKTTLNQLNHLFSTPIPVYYILTKCDQIYGFHEFFMNLTKEDREQIWGILFPNTHLSTQQLEAHFNNEFNELILKLNERLLLNLDTEQDPQARLIISYFPQQMQVCQQLLQELIIQDSRTRLQGLFFMSSLQEGIPFDAAGSHLAKQFNLPPLNHAAAISQKKAFFTKRLFTDVILPKHNWVFQTSNWRQHILDINRTTTTVAAVLLGVWAIGLSFSLATNYSNNKRVAEYIPIYEQAIHDFAISNRSLIDLIPVLDTLKRIQDIYGKNRSWVSDLEIYQPWRINSQLSTIWQTNLSNLFLPSVFNRLEFLLQQDQLPPDLLYQVLKGYFVFSSIHNLDPTWLKNPVAYDLSATLPNQPETQQKLLSYLSEAINAPIKVRKLNAQLIAQAQAKLQNIPPVQFAYYEIKQEWENTSHQTKLEQLAGENFSTVFTYKNPSLNTLSNFYTLSGYEDLRDKGSKDFIQYALESYHILGINPPSDVSSTNLQMTPALWSLYGTDYIQYWQNLLTNIQVVNFSNLSQAIEVLNNLLDTNSPLSQLLRLIKANTAKLDANNLQVAQQFAPLNAQSPTLLKTESPSPYDDLYKSLHTLRDYLISLNNAPNTNETEFADAAAIMQNKFPSNPIVLLRHQATQLPAPLQQWITEIADNSLSLLLQGAQQTINKNWQSNVIPVYHSNIRGRFPFTNNKAKILDVDNFSNFFGGKGVFNQFLQNYLAPFIDTSHGNWHLLQIDNISLNLPGSALAQIQHAALISNMYFQNGDNKPYMQFSIQPLFLDSESSSVNVQLDNQAIAYRHGPQQSIQWIWPTTSETSQASISINDFQGQNFSQSLEGFWGWFELLDAAHLQADGNGHYIWTFVQKKHQASFAIIAHNNMPLFDFKSLQTFTLPDSI